jgi:hypothetical protein
MPELRAPENSFTGIEIKPKVRYPDQTEAAIVHPMFGAGATSAGSKIFSREEVLRSELKLHPSI